MKKNYKQRIITRLGEYTLNFITEQRTKVNKENAKRYCHFVKKIGTSRCVRVLDSRQLITSTQHNTFTNITFTHNTFTHKLHSVNLP